MEYVLSAVIVLIMAAAGYFAMGKVDEFIREQKRLRTENKNEISALCDIIVAGTKDQKTDLQSAAAAKEAEPQHAREEAAAAKGPKPGCVRNVAAAAGKPPLQYARGRGEK